MKWQLQDAKARFSEVVDRAIREGPQVVTRRGRDAVVIIDAAEFERLRERRLSLKEALTSGPEGEFELPERSTNSRHDVEW